MPSVIIPGRRFVQIDTSALRRHCASLNDEEILSIDRNDLTAAAQKIYDAEFARRNLTVDSAGDPQPSSFDPASLPQFDAGPDPDWLPEAAIATSFPSAPEAQQARDALTAAGIPSHLTVTDGSDEDPEREQEFQILVPNALTLHANNVLEKAIFNPNLESTWRELMHNLSDQEFGLLTEETICAGYEDLIHRYQRIWRQELARRAAAAHAG